MNGFSRFAGLGYLGQADLSGGDPSLDPSTGLPWGQGLDSITTPTDAQGYPIDATQPAASSGSGSSIFSSILNAFGGVANATAAGLRAANNAQSFNAPQYVPAQQASAGTSPLVWVAVGLGVIGLVFVATRRGS